MATRQVHEVEGMFLVHVRAQVRAESATAAIDAFQQADVSIDVDGSEITDAMAMRRINSVQTLGRRGNFYMGDPFPGAQAEGDFGKFYKASEEQSGITVEDWSDDEDDCELCHDDEATVFGADDYDALCRRCADKVESAEDRA